jgi:hypothetical protein
MEIIGVYFDIQKMCGENNDFIHDTAGGIYRNHSISGSLIPLQSP